MGRKSINEYPPDWPEISARVKENSGWRCVRCDHFHDIENGYVLTVHHLDLDKSNCAWWNLAALCQRCHLHIQAKVVLERPWIFDHSEWFKPFAAGYYASLHGFPSDKNYVTEHLNFLLDLGKPHIERNCLEARG